MTQVTALPIEQRNNAGTGSARDVRRQGFVPGIIYGAGQDPVMFQVNTKTLIQELRDPHHNTKLYDLELGKKNQRAIIRDVQLDPVTDAPLHIDFLRVDQSSRIAVNIPLRFINEDKSPGIKRGGVLNIVVHELQLTCPATAIPEELVIDLAGLEVGHSIHIDVLNLSADVTPTHAAQDQTLATIVAPSGLKSEESGQDTAEADAK